jgi:hypothetical protein
MKSMIISIKPSRKLILIISVTLFALLLTVSVVSAALLNINTNDGTASDWSGVSLFQSDPVDDLNGSCTGGTDQDDIIETYVASGPAGTSPNNIYFLVKFKNTNPSASAIQYHQISAYMDCQDSGGNYGQDNLDANVVYRPFADQTVLCNGVQDCKLYNTNDPNGQRATSGTSNFTLEWLGVFNDMETFTTPGPLNCSDQEIARIKIIAFKSNTQGFYSCTFDETGWRDFNSPTDVDIVSLNSSNPFEDPKFFISTVSLALALLIGSFALYISVKKKSSLR